MMEKNLPLQQFLWKLVEEVGKTGKVTVVSFDGPTKGGFWFLDCSTDENHKMNVEFRPERGFGISEANSKPIFGEGPDHVFEFTEGNEQEVTAEAVKHALTLLTTPDETSKSAPSSI